MSETKINRTVTIVAYLKDRFESTRDWADGRSDLDYHEREVIETTSRYHEIGGVRTHINSEQYEELKGMNLGDGSIIVEVENDERYKHNVRKEVTRLVSEIVEDWDVPKKLFGEYEYVSSPVVGWRDDGWNRIIKIYTRHDEMPLLKHQSQIEDQDEMYVDEDEKFPVLKLRIVMGDSTEDMIHTMSERVVEPIMEGISKHEDVARTRIVKCEQKESGACYNI